MGVTAIIMYLIVIIALLLPNLGDLTIPVFIYALVLSTMLLFVKFDGRNRQLVYFDRSCSICQLRQLSGF
jgi:hypothetical protein